MTRAEVATMLGTLEIPFAYYQFAEGTNQACPFICYYYRGDDDFLADNVNYAPIRRLIIELYTDNKDFTKEATVESTLTSNGLVFSKSEDYIGSERMYMTTYETEVVLTNE